jgi:hypothetical protein
VSLGFDRNSNGRSDTGEVKTLSAVGITALSVGAEFGSDGVLTTFAGVRWSDGRVSTPGTGWLILRNRSMKPVSTPLLGNIQLACNWWDISPITGRKLSQFQ